MEKKWNWQDWILFVIRLIALVSVIYNASFAKGSFFIPYSSVIVLIGISYLVPLLLLIKSRTLYVFSELFFLLLLTPIFSVTDSTLAGNFVTYSMMLGFYQDQRVKRWGIVIGIAVLMAGPIPSLSISPISYISVVLSGLVFYGIGIIFNQLIFTKEEIQKKNEIIEQQYKVLEQYSKQVEQTAILKERNRISTEIQQSVSQTFASLLLKMEIAQQQISESLLDELIEDTYQGMSEVREAIQQLDGLDVVISIEETMRNMVENVRKTSNLPIDFIVKGEEKAAIQNQTLFTLSSCLQELLINAINIGKAQMLVVSLRFEADSLEVRVEDDGMGSEQERMQAGLVKLYEPLRVIKGELACSSFLNKGHMAACRVPYLGQAEEASMRLLVVDSNSLVRESLIHYLQLQSGMTVIGHAACEEEAIRICEVKRPNLIVIDSLNISGTEVTQSLKEIHPEAKVIILTSNDNVEEAIDAIHAGAEGFISKNTPLQEMITKMRLISMGETIISQSVARQLIKGMKTADQTKVRQEKWQQEHGLTDREVEVLRYLADGLKYKEISETLFLAEGTVRNYISNIYAKLEVKDRKQAAQKAVQSGIL